MALSARVSDLMPFDLLLSVARLGSLGRAAEAHGISQPAASIRLRRLERRLGLDLGFVEGPDLPAGLRARRAGADVLTVVVPAAHPWARRRSGITATELAATGLVSREPASGTRRFFEQALRTQAAAEPASPVAELSSTTAIKSAVMAGIGPAVLSSLAVAAEVAAGTLRAVPVRGLDLTRELRAVSAEGRPLTGPASDLDVIAVRAAQRPAGSWDG